MKFREIVNKSGLTGLELSHIVGIPSANIYAYMSGRRNNPSLETAFKLADALKIDINELRNAFKKDDEEKVHESKN
ncbi:helix-turn-helix domain-containing protein [Aerococcus urinae]|uniref:helix-turn-helix domain-containing protein n=1 Tax=Aerococcus urinae TaxID=1376 RepID=UPI00254A95AD|nr:helix-turn-helix transcriptional regulator [Aerococcus urinae]MDK7716049.1 helix-turn-helix transcriptional regulator [Aerococcus urinae]